VQRMIHHRAVRVISNKSGEQRQEDEQLSEEVIDKIPSVQPVNRQTML